MVRIQHPSLCGLSVRFKAGRERYLEPLPRRGLGAITFLWSVRLNGTLAASGGSDNTEIADVARSNVR